jgi:hypothetical protein
MYATETDFELDQSNDWCRMPFQLRGVSFPLVLLNVHFVSVIFSWFNWRYFINAEVSLLGDQTPRLYVAFVVIGTIFFFLFGSLYLYASYRWAAFLREKSRRNRVLSGVAIVYLSHVLPLWIMEFGIIWTYGWMSLLQSAHFVFLSVIWILETLTVWLAYTWHGAGLLHEKYGSTMFGAQS